METRARIRNVYGDGTAGEVGLKVSSNPIVAHGSVGRSFRTTGVGDISVCTKYLVFVVNLGKNTCCRQQQEHDNPYYSSHIFNI